jgi:hypothetical protein
MSDFKVVDQRIIAQAIADTSTTQKLPLGTRVRARDESYGEGEFVYAKGVTSTVVGSVVLFDEDGWTTSLATANDKGLLGTAMSINVGSQYGWYQVFGKGVAKVLAGFADNADCYLTSTAGSVDDTVVAGDYIRGMKGASAIDTPSTGLAEVELFYPSVKDGLDDATT